MRRAAVVLLLAVACHAATARAGEARCWVDRGVVVTSAAAGDIAGDFILDLSAPHSALEADVAASHGLAGPQVAATLTWAGESRPARFDVVSLNARTLGLPTTINGVIGADALAGRAMDLSLSPCRLFLWRGRPARLAAPVVSLPLAMADGAPLFPASISDGRVALKGWFALDTAGAAVRIAGEAASLSRAAADPASRLAPPARLDALGVGGLVRRDLPAAIAGDLPTGVLGGVGDAAWVGYDLRIDLKRMRLVVSEPRSARSGGSWRRAGR